MKLMCRLRHSLIQTALLGAMALVASVHTAAADPMLFAAVGVNLGCTPAVTCPNTDGNDDVDFGVSANGFINVTDATDGFNDPNFVYSATADPQFGRLRAGASGSYNLSSSSTRMAGAFAVAQDELTIGAPGLDGQAGTLDVSVTLDGTLNRIGGAGAAAWVAVDSGSDPNPFSGNNQSFSFDYVTVPVSPTVVTVDLVWGQPFYLTMILGAAVGTPLTCLACRGGDSNVGPATGAGSATADFLNTLTLSGLLPRDANGNPVLTAQYSSASTTQYSVNGVVPEPGTLLLLATGLALTLRRRRLG
jgi:hypothetical protein